MARIFNHLTEVIGGTPLLRLSKTESENNLQARLLAKLESFNPGGSAKDRVALAMIDDAERRGLLKPGGTIVEPTSGNTGVGLAWIAAVRGYRAIFTMPETMSIERRKLLAAFGAEIVLTPGSEGMAGAISKAEDIERDTEGAFMPLQFANPANPKTHRETTAQEIWHDTDGKIDFFVAGVGTGGTVSGTAEGLKAYNAAIKAVAVEPVSSAVITTGKAGPHKIQGIGAGFVPPNYNATVIDEVITVADEDAFAAARRIAATEGILVGISSGAALHAAIEVARRPENKNKTVVVLLPDTGERYLSTKLF